MTSSIMLTLLVSKAMVEPFQLVLAKPAAERKKDLHYIYGEKKKK